MCSFGQIFFPKHVKNDATRNLELFSAKKTAGNNTEYSTNETMQNGQFNFNFFFPKTCWKRFYKNNRVVLCKKTACKNIEYSRHETTLQIDHFGKCIAYASPRLVMHRQRVSFSLPNFWNGVKTFMIYAATSHYDVGIKILPISHRLPFQVRDELY